jgi:hypothetical protein
MMSDLAKLVIKRFPENRNMQLVCLRAPAEFHCSRCKRRRRATMLAVISDDWEQLACVPCYKKRLSEKLEEPPTKTIPEQWLGAIVSLRDAEKDNVVMGVPFGNQAAEWEDFMAAILDGDEVCEFASPPDRADSVAEQAGYALVREGKIVKYIVIVANES